MFCCCGCLIVVGWIVVHVKERDVVLLFVKEMTDVGGLFFRFCCEHRVLLWGESVQKDEVEMVRGRIDGRVHKKWIVVIGGGCLLV